MCEHEFVQEEWIVEVCKKCDKLRAQTVFEADLAAAKAELAAEREKAATDTFAGQTWVTFSEHMKALNKIKQMEDAIKFDFERFMDFQRRAEQAEAQCAAMRNCDNCNKWCMKQPNKSEFDTLNRIDNCKFNNLSHWELSKKIKAALEDKP